MSSKKDAIVNIGGFLAMNSRDRMVASICCEEPDRVPVYLRVFERNYLVNRDLAWRSRFERVKLFLSLGLDDVLNLHPPLMVNPEVEVKVVKKPEAGEEYPILVKKYSTPKGTLKHIVKMTRDWPHGEDIPVFDDYIVPRTR